MTDHPQQRGYRVALRAMTPLVVPIGSATSFGKTISIDGTLDGGNHLDSRDPALQRKSPRRSSPRDREASCPHKPSISGFSCTPATRTGINYRHVQQGSHRSVVALLTDPTHIAPIALGRHDFMGFGRQGTRSVHCSRRHPRLRAHTPH